MNFQKIQLPKEKIIEFCRQWKITEFSFFGSVLRQDFRPDSDIDILVAFADDAKWTLLDLVKMQLQLEQIVARKVDIIEKRVIEKSHNWIRRREILETAKIFDVER